MVTGSGDLIDTLCTRPVAGYAIFVIIMEGAHRTRLLAYKITIVVNLSISSQAFITAIIRANLAMITRGYTIPGLNIDVEMLIT